LDDEDSSHSVFCSRSQMRTLWTMIGDSYPGNPYYKEVRTASQASVYADEEVLVADDAVMADDVTDAAMASTEDDTAIVAEDAIDSVAN